MYTCIYIYIYIYTFIYIHRQMGGGALRPPQTSATPSPRSIQTAIYIYIPLYVYTIYYIHIVYYYDSY